MFLCYGLKRLAVVVVSITLFFTLMRRIQRNSLEFTSTFTTLRLEREKDPIFLTPAMHHDYIDIDGSIGGYKNVRETHMVADNVRGHTDIFTGVHTDAESVVEDITTNENPHEDLIITHKVAEVQNVVESHRNNTVSPASTITEQPQPVGELHHVLSNVETCLAAAGLLEYRTAAKENAKYFLGVLRQVIPIDFSSTYRRSSCWQTEFRVTVLSQGMRFRIGNITSGPEHGHIGSKSEHMRFQSALVKDLMLQHHGLFSSPFVCLPKIFIAGFSKCGSTFLYCFLNKIIHSSLGVRPSESEKEIHWWVEAGYKPKPHKPIASDIGKYILNFARGLDAMEKSQYNMVMIDGSPNILWSWPRFYPNEGLVNYCLLPSIIPQVLPTSKFIVVMRNPLDMLYSAFWFSCTMRGIKLSMTTRLKGPEIFHERIVEKIKQFNNCTKSYSLDRCVFHVSFNIFNGTTDLKRCGRSRLDMALYYVHVRKWLSIVPRDKFLFLTLEEISTDSHKVAKKIIQFLELPVPHVTDYETSCFHSLNTQESIDYHNDPRLQLRADTRDYLKRFFRPFNQKLAELISDKKFLWEDN